MPMLIFYDGNGGVAGSEASAPSGDALQGKLPIMGVGRLWPFILFLFDYRGVL